MPKKSAKVIKCLLQVVVVANSEEQEPSDLCEDWYTFDHRILNFNSFWKYEGIPPFFVPKKGGGGDLLSFSSA